MVSRTKQHVNMRSIRIARNGNDDAKLADWLSQHNLFPQVDRLHSINWGVVGGKRLKCHMSQKIGALAMAKTSIPLN